MKKIIFAVMFLPLMLFAQSYNIDQLVEIGIKNNLDLQQSELSKELANSQLHKSYWDLVPDVTADFNRTDYLYLEKGSTHQNNSLGLNVTKTIYLNDPQYYSYKFAKFDKKTSELKYENEKRSFILQIVSAYISLLDSQKQLEVQKSNQTIQENILQQTKILYRQKKNTEFDVTQSEITLLNVQIAITKLNNDISSKRNQLFNLINCQDQGFPLEDLTIKEDYQLPDFNTANNKDIELLQREIDRTDLSLNQTKLSFLPDLSLKYRYAKENFSPDFSFDDTSKSHTLMLNASYSLWNFFKNKENYSQTYISKKSKELSLKSKSLNLENQYQQYKDNLNYFKQLDNLYAIKKDNTKLNLVIAEKRYELGMIEQIELDKARFENFDAIQAYESNKYKLIELAEQVNFLLSNKILNKY